MLFSLHFPLTLGLGAAGDETEEEGLQAALEVSQLCLDPELQILRSAEADAGNPIG